MGYKYTTDFTIEKRANLQIWALDVVFVGLDEVPDCGVGVGAAHLHAGQGDRVVARVERAAWPNKNRTAWNMV